MELVVGGTPIKPTNPVTGKRTRSLSGYKAGFSNPFNVYIWQVKWYNDMLLASTFDHGSNIEVLRDIALLNKDALIKEFDENIYNMIITIYDAILYLFKKYNYPRGFDLFASFDGVHFKPINLTGLGNGNNYGGRILFVSEKENDLYIGTANPYDGCEILRAEDDDFCITPAPKVCQNYPDNVSYVHDEINKMIEDLIKEIRKTGKSIL